MKVLVLGGTRFFGKHMVRKLLERGHDVTIATRGRTQDDFGNAVSRIIVERTDGESMKKAFTGKKFDVAIDKIAYCSDDIRYAMEYVDCGRYIHMSSTSVYEPKTINTVEDDFDGLGKPLIWCDRGAFPYEEIKRQAEYALWQAYPHRKWAAVRYPFAVGKDDYTKRLLFYVEHVMKGIPMHIDNIDCKMGFIRSDEAGYFLAFLAENDFTGAVNGAAHGKISLREIIGYVEKKTGAKAVLSVSGEDAPYNGEPEYSINVEKAEEMGFRFSDLHDWIYELLDHYISSVGSK